MTRLVRAVCAELPAAWGAACTTTGGITVLIFLLTLAQGSY